MSEKSKPRYSGPNCSGVCRCGCPWDRHHLGVVMNMKYAEETGEAYIPQECDNYGFNETGGMKFENGKWVDHCNSYVDNKEKINGG